MSEQLPTKSSTGLKENTAGLLCYLVGWITGIVFLILEKESKFVKFHAIQSIIVFGAITIIEWILGKIPIIGGILGALLGVGALILWIICMMKAYNGQKYKLPIAGDMAENYSK